MFFRTPSLPSSPARLGGGFVDCRNGLSDAAWHVGTANAVFRRLESRCSGLSDDEAAQRLETMGPNRLPRAKPVSAARIFVNQLTSVVVFLLGAAAIVALAL